MCVLECYRIINMDARDAGHLGEEATPNTDN